MFDFPNSPAVGAVYSPGPGLPSYRWDGTGWNAVVPAPPQAVTDDNPPASPVDGQFWWKSSTGQFFVWYQDVNSAQWVQIYTAQPSPLTGKTARRGNRVVNPSMAISQENGNAAGTSVTTYYPADQWLAGGSVVGAYTVQRVQVTTPVGAADRFRWTITTGAAAAAGANMNFQTKIEGSNVADLQWGTAAAVQAVVRFMWRSPAGTYTVGLRNNNNDRTYLVPFTVSAAQANIDTVQTFVIPGDVTGTWATVANPGLVFHICFVASTGTPIGVPGWQAGGLLALSGTPTATTTGQVFDLSDVGIYADPDATGLPPPWEVPDLATELMKCQRYYNKMYSILLAGYNVGGANIYVTMTRPVAMRVTPANSVQNLLNVSNVTTLTVSNNMYNMISYAVQIVATGSGSLSFDSAWSARM